MRRAPRGWKVGKMKDQAAEETIWVCTQCGGEGLLDVPGALIKGFHVFVVCHRCVDEWREKSARRAGWKPYSERTSEDETQ